MPQQLVLEDRAWYDVCRFLFSTWAEVPMEHETRTFHFSTVLSVAHNRYVCIEGLSGILQLLSFMTDDSIEHHQIPRVGRECAPHLIAQFPLLASKEMQTSLALYRAGIAAIDNDDATEKRRHSLQWLGELRSGVYDLTIDETLELQKLPPGVHERIDPESELTESVHPDQSIVIGTNPHNEDWN